MILVPQHSPDSVALRQDLPIVEVKRFLLVLRQVLLPLLNLDLEQLELHHLTSEINPDDHATGHRYLRTGHGQQIYPLRVIVQNHVANTRVALLALRVD